MTSVSLRQTDWNNSAETAKDNTAFVSTINTASVSKCRRTVSLPIWKSSIIIERRERSMIKTPKMSEILREEFMEPFNVSAYRLAKDIRVPVSRIQDILHDRRKISVDTSLRLGKYFGVSERYFLNLQNDIDVRNAKKSLHQELDSIRQLIA